MIDKSILKRIVESANSGPGADEHQMRIAQYAYEEGVESVKSIVVVCGCEYSLKFNGGNPGWFITESCPSHRREEEPTLTQDELHELLARIYNHDDKPHQLYTFCRAMALKYDDGLHQEEALRVMDYAIATSTEPYRMKEAIRELMKGFESARMRAHEEYTKAHQAILAGVIPEGYAAKNLAELQVWADKIGKVSHDLNCISCQLCYTLINRELGHLIPDGMYGKPKPKDPK